MKDQLKSSLPVLQLMLLTKLMHIKFMLKHMKTRYFIHQEIGITNNKIVIEDPSIEVTKILKIKIRIKKMNPLNNQGEISRCNFCGSKFHWEKNCPDDAEKYNHDL